jgi:hypothetical protein
MKASNLTWLEVQLLQILDDNNIKAHGVIICILLEALLDLIANLIAVTENRDFKKLTGQMTSRDEREIVG